MDTVRCPLCMICCCICYAQCATAFGTCDQMRLARLACRDIKREGGVLKVRVPMSYACSFA